MATPTDPTVTVEQLVAAFNTPEVTAYTQLLVTATEDVYQAFLDVVDPDGTR